MILLEKDKDFLKSVSYTHLDVYKRQHVVFTGSSVLEILNAKSDLSRRAIVYEMQGFSFREYLNWNEKLSLPILTLNNILDNHLSLSCLLYTSSSEGTNETELLDFQ